MRLLTVQYPEGERMVLYTHDGLFLDFNTREELPTPPDWEEAPPEEPSAEPKQEPPAEELPKLDKKMKE